MFARKMRVAIANGIDSMSPGLWLDLELRFRAHHFEDEIRLLPVLCDRRLTAIDVGANTGAYSYCMQKYSARVIAFEPNTVHWKRLRRLLKAQGSLEGVALSNTSGPVNFRVDEQNDGLATIEQKNELGGVIDKASVLSHTVMARTLDSYNLKDISLIKIDVEGHEESVIEGARETIANNRPAFIIESEDRHNPGSPRRLIQMLAKLGYGAFYLKEERLHDVATLEDGDLDPDNVWDKSTKYVNNFIFLPRDNDGKYNKAYSHLIASAATVKCE